MRHCFNEVQELFSYLVEAAFDDYDEETDQSADSDETERQKDVSPDWEMKSGDCVVVAAVAAAGSLWDWCHCW